VAIALIETGMSPIDAVEFVRQRRRGALNSVQLAFLMDTYKRQFSKKTKRNTKPATTPPAMSKENSATGILSRVFKFSSKKSNENVSS
jgi:hypothetical protein